MVEEDFSPLDIHFARLMERLSGRTSRELFHASALVSRATRQGDVCLDLSSAATPCMEEGSCLKEVGLKDALLKSEVVGRPGDYAPLILDKAGRLYLYRYWDYERRLCEALINKAGRIEKEVHPLMALRLKEIYPPDREADLQKAATFMALQRGLCVISGGPGTGKTRTASWILALALELSYERPLRIALAAPTGKAAARLQESIRSMAQSKTAEALFAKEVLDAIPKEASTIHRLLGSRRGSPYFIHNRENPLPVDLVVIDEASMADLALMSKLIQALPQKARLILLGDRNQLASVEAGAVLGDICFGMQTLWFSDRLVEGYKKATGELLKDPSGRPPPPSSAISIRDSMIELRKNYRFGSSSAMAALSEAVKEGRCEGVLEILRQDKSGQVVWRGLPATGELKGALRPLVLECWSGYLRSRDPAEMLKGFDRLRILCAVRRGPYGVEAVNGIVEEILREEGLIRARGPWYMGRPVMVTGNDYALRLFNGDVGMTAPDGGGGLKVYFEGGQGAVRAFSPYRMPPHETVFATTVHKSQGSEFEEVLVILPERDVPILTRELLYTGITRSKGRAALWAEEETIRIAVSRRIERASGLRDSLWGDSVASALSS